jgi:hypothetical protein
MNTISTENLTPETENMGFWDKTYMEEPIPSNATMSIAFSGWSDVEKVLSDSNKVLNELVGTKYICIGGGNENGAFTPTNLQALTKAIEQGDFSDYDGIAYDIEEGSPGLESYFVASFSAAKVNDFKVLVTISHSAPYGIDDAATLMNTFFEDSNIDIISPQLYNKGDEENNNYDISHEVEWASYAKCKAAVVPSIVKGELYPSAQEHFSVLGVTLKGYVQWSPIVTS